MNEDPGHFALNSFGMELTADGRIFLFLQRCRSENCQTLLYCQPIVTTAKVWEFIRCDKKATVVVARSDALVFLLNCDSSTLKKQDRKEWIINNRNKIGHAQDFSQKITRQPTELCWKKLNVVIKNKIEERMGSLELITL